MHSGRRLSHRQVVPVFLTMAAAQANDWPATMRVTSPRPTTDWTGSLIAVLKYETEWGMVERVADIREGIVSDILTFDHPPAPTSHHLLSLDLGGRFTFDTSDTRLGGWLRSAGAGASLEDLKMHYWTEDEIAHALDASSRIAEAFLRCAL